MLVSFAHNVKLQVFGQCRTITFEVFESSYFISDFTLALSFCFAIIVSLFGSNNVMAYKLTI